MPNIFAVSGAPMTTLFEGFAYAGCRDAGDLNAGVERSGLYPNNLEPESVYLFKRRRAYRDKAIFMELQNRLRSLGFAIVRAPKEDGSGIVLLEPSGMHFSIEVRNRNCTVLIETLLGESGYHPREWPWQEPEWEVETYALGASSGCELLVLPS